MISILPFLLKKGIRGIAVYPFIFLANKELKENKVIINHEKIHHAQQKEMLWLFFFIWYSIEYLYHYFKTKDANIAYMQISFEKEAYLNDQNLNYLKNRNFWAFLKYVKTDYKTYK